MFTSTKESDYLCAWINMGPLQSDKQAIRSSLAMSQHTQQAGGHGTYSQPSFPFQLAQ